MEEIIGMLTEQEIRIAENSIATAQRLGAQKVRVSLDKSLMELFGTLNGELDKVSHCMDRSLSICLYVDGKFGTFSTNRLDESEIEKFLANAVATVRMLAEDKCRDLPDPSRTSKEAVTGKELGLFDETYSSLTSEERLKTALDAAVFGRFSDKGLISEEGEYSDSIYDSLILDSNGTRCRHTETSFEYGVEVTIQDADGNKYSDYWWDSSPWRSRHDISGIGETAYKRAMAQVGPVSVESGKYSMVVSTECASKLVSPVINALNAYSIQQNNSFLLDTVGKKVFPEGLTIVDAPHRKGETGSRLFDSEGVATSTRPFIEKGVVKEYFVNTYMSNKMGIAPTNEDVTRPQVLPFNAKGEVCGTLDKDDILELVGDGILVTGFNGGNSNSATGDFSYGVQGYLFRNGKIVHPVREMLVTGNFITLWNNLVAAGNDARTCTARLVPTLAFEGVDFSA